MQCAESTLCPLRFSVLFDSLFFLFLAIRATSRLTKEHVQVILVNFSLFLNVSGADNVILFTRLCAKWLRNHLKTLSKV